MDDEAQAWKEAGQLLKEGRESVGLSKREAARVAGFSEITWRQLEDGERQISRGVKVPVSPKDETLAAAGIAARVVLEDLFRIVDRELPPHLEDRIRRKVLGDRRIDIEFEDGTAVEVVPTISAQGVDLAELKELDPDAYAQVVELAKFHLDRARERREE